MTKTRRSARASVAAGLGAASVSLGTTAPIVAPPPAGAQSLGNIYNYQANIAGATLNNGSDHAIGGLRYYVNTHSSATVGIGMQEVCGGQYESFKQFLDNLAPGVWFPSTHKQFNVSGDTCGGRGGQENFYGVAAFGRASGGGQRAYSGAFAVQDGGEVRGWACYIGGSTRWSTFCTAHMKSGAATGFAFAQTREYYDIVHNLWAPGTRVFWGGDLYVRPGQWASHVWRTPLNYQEADDCFGGRQATYGPYDGGGVLTEKFDWTFSEKPAGCDGDLILRPYGNVFPDYSSDHKILMSRAG